jgi:hypothetical protein
LFCNVCDPALEVAVADEEKKIREQGGASKAATGHDALH